jgi:uncharacterized protein (DUF885 family)
MRLPTTILLITFLIPVCLIPAGCGSGNSGGTQIPSGPGDTPPSQPPPTQPPPPDTEVSPSEQLADDLSSLAFSDFVDISYRSLLLRDPEAVIALGDEADIELEDVGLTSIVPVFTAETQAMLRVIADQLERFDPSSLSHDHQVTLAVYKWYLEDRLTAAGFDGLPYAASYFLTSVPSDLETFFGEIHPVATEQDARDFVERLRLVDSKINQLVLNIRSDRANGIVMPARMLEWSINRWNQVATGNPRQLGYYAPLEAAASSLPAASRDEILLDAITVVRNEILPAYGNLVQELESARSQAPSGIGVDQQTNGDDYYRYALRHHTGTDMTPDEVHALGLRELNRIHAEMRSVFDELGYPASESIAASYQRVISDSGVVSAGQIVAAYESIITDAEGRLSEAFDVLPIADVIVVGGQGGGYYIRPSLDGSRPGAFHVSTQNLDYPFQMKSLAYHEAVPGHHLQIAVAQEQGLSLMRQNVSFTGFVEGWALYAERLAWELGWYDGDPLGNLGRLQYEAFRAARLVVDTGIHSRGWSLDEAVQFFQTNVGFSRGASENQVARYMAWPGQATAYMTGMLAILAQREQLRAELGADFDIKSFHNTLLTSGAVPASLLNDLFQ